MSVAELVKCLEAINACDEIEPQDDDVLNCGYIEDCHLLVQNAVSLANQVLISDGGQRDYKNEKELSKEGFYVSCLEHDEFGWLSGRIHTNRGIIAYG